MPVEADDEIQDMPDNASGSDQVAETASKEAAPESAKSTSAQGETEATTLSLVRDVIDGKNKEAAAASPAESQETGPTPDETQTKKEPAEDYSDVPFHKHPRFQELVRKTKDLEADATRYRNVDNFCRTNNVSAEEAADALVLAASAKTDPVGTLERMKPWIVDLMKRAGAILPDELQQGVAQGVYTPQSAAEIARLRAQTQSFETLRQHEAQQAQMRQQEAAAAGVTNAATSWEADRRVKDPNFEAKLPSLMKEVAWLHTTEGKPTTPQGVTDQLQRAYTSVNKSFVPPAPVVPPRLATRPVMGGQVNGSAPAAGPKSTLEIVQSYTRRRA